MLRPLRTCGFAFGPFDARQSKFWKLSLPPHCNQGISAFQEFGVNDLAGRASVSWTTLVRQRKNRRITRKTESPLGKEQARQSGPDWTIFWHTLRSQTPLVGLNPWCRVIKPGAITHTTKTHHAVFTWQKCFKQMTQYCFRFFAFIFISIDDTWKSAVCTCSQLSKVSVSGCFKLH